jgi:fluoroquinolone transport system permease protein
MPSTIAVRGMLRTDALRVSRDRFLIGITLYILAVTAAMRWLIPSLTIDIAAEWRFNLTPYHPLLISYFIVQLAPMVPGIIGGFLLLESREDGTVKALLVSPNPLTGYIAIVCVVMFVSAMMLTVVQATIIGVALPPLPALIAVGLAAASGAPMFALLIAALANNKVQAFAYMKVFGLGPLLVTLAYFLPEPWQWSAAIYPPYCASKAYWVAEAGGGEWPLWILGGLASSVIWIGVLQCLFLRAAQK